jgi:hypothetical protein
MFSGAPRTLVALIVAVVSARLLLGLLTPGPLIFPLLQVGLLSLVAWKALGGSNRAGFVFAALLVVSALTTTYQLVTTARVPPVNVVVFGSWVALLLGTAAFISLHPVVRRFYADRSEGGDLGH